jgi:predicted kinase
VVVRVRAPRALTARVPDPQRHHGRIARLILLNGAPGVGKSTVARRYLDDHPLALLVEIDVLRCSLGGWEERPESRLVARSLALALARAHLRSGHDVIVPQYLGRSGFIDALAGVAGECGAELREIVLMADETTVTERFRERRARLATDRRPHPQSDVAEATVGEVVADAVERLRAVVAGRPQVGVVAVDGTVEATYRALLAALADG